MKANAENSEPKPSSSNDLKSLPMSELQTRLHSSPDGLSQAEAQKRLTQYGPNEIAEKKTNRIPEIPDIFLGSDSLDD